MNMNKLNDSKLDNEIIQYLDHLKFEKKLSNNTILAYKNDLCKFCDYLQKHI